MQSVTIRQQKVGVLMSDLIDFKKKILLKMKRDKKVKA